MSANDVKKIVKEFLSDRFMIGRSIDSLKDSDSMLEKGIIDSTGVLEVVGFIEETFGFTIGDEELIPEYLDSVNNIVAFVTRKAGHTV